MALLTMHKILIVSAAVLCAGFAVREGLLIAMSSHGGSMVVAGASTAAGAGLIFYLRWLLRSKRGQV